MPIRETLAVIDTPRFCGGIVLWDDVVIETAPFARFMRKWKRDRVRAYCCEKGWKIHVVHELTRERP